VKIRTDGTLATGFVPVHVDPPGRPRICSDTEAEVVVRYVQEITTGAGLPTISFEYRDGIAWTR
jgi:poly-gamma-glutamate synthesis protein (capsule biosynthesis protein)